MFRNSGTFSLPSGREASDRPSSPGVKRAIDQVRVLVVDDQPEFVRAVRRVLSAKGYLVEVASDGAMAASRIAEVDEMFDVVVTDVAMPGIDGIELMRRVQTRDPAVPVVLITGSPQVATAIKAVEHGAFHYLVKPVSLATLENAISQAAEARLQQQMALVLLNSQPPPSQISNIDLADSFTRALHSLWIAYQPIVHAGSNHPFGYEVLLRSDEPSLPDPSRVLDAAEQLGRLQDIGRFVRTRAAAALRSRPPSVCLFVNVHTEDLLDPLLLQEESPLTRVADRVVLEITERASIERVDDLQERVARLREFGYRIALDDMGAGYANLNTLALLEPEIVKLDMSLVRGLHLNKTKQKLVRSIIQLCRDMDMLVVGEGVESVEEQDALVALGCDLLQGFLFSTPERTLPRSDTPPPSDED